MTPPLAADANGTLTPFGDAIARAYARALIGRDGARARQARIVAGRPGNEAVLDVINDCDADPAYARLVAR